MTRINRIRRWCSARARSTKGPKASPARSPAWAPTRGLVFLGIIPTPTSPPEWEDGDAADAQRKSLPLLVATHLGAGRGQRRQRGGRMARLVRISPMRKFAPAGCL
eukprot:scaffold118277_cov29-Tisochrysis_lutea.AAC.3